MGLSNAIINLGTLISNLTLAQWVQRRYGRR